MDTLPQIFSTGWASGVNAYATVFVLGLLQRIGVGHVPDELGRPEVIGVAGLLLAVELVVDKVPYLDSGWDAIHTAVRPTVGTVLGVLMASDSSNVSELLGGSTGGGTALLTHAVKAGFRLAVNISPEPFSNFIVSTAEDIAVVMMVLMSVSTPWFAAAVALLLLIVGLCVVGMAVIYARRFWRWRRPRSTFQPDLGDVPATPPRR
jgi:hypothetical protein